MRTSSQDLRRTSVGTSFRIQLSLSFRWIITFYILVDKSKTDGVYHMLIQHHIHGFGPFKPFTSTNPAVCRLRFLSWSNHWFSIMQPFIFLRISLVLCSSICVFQECYKFIFYYLWFRCYTLYILPSFLLFLFLLFSFPLPFHFLAYFPSTFHFFHPFSFFPTWGPKQLETCLILVNFRAHWSPVFLPYCCYATTSHRPFLPLDRNNKP